MTTRLLNRLLSLLFGLFNAPYFTSCEWKYHNPYNRTCTICGRHEVSHCAHGAWFYSWWEVWNKGEQECHRRGPKP